MIPRKLTYVHGFRAKAPKTCHCRGCGDEILHGEQMTVLDVTIGEKPFTAYICAICAKLTQPQLTSLMKHRALDRLGMLQSDRFDNAMARVKCSADHE